MLAPLALSALAGLAIAAPAVEERANYASYGAYNPPSGGYGKYASYGSYGAPSGGSGSGGSSSGSGSQLPVGIGAPTYTAGGFSGRADGLKSQPFKFPLTNGFPNVAMGSSQLMDIQKQAHGTLPNTPLPSSMSDDSAATWQVIAFNEIWEVAFFTSLLTNITDGTYDVGSGAAKQIIVNAITAIQVSPARRGKSRVDLLNARAYVSL